LQARTSPGQGRRWDSPPVSGEGSIARWFGFQLPASGSYRSTDTTPTPSLPIAPLAPGAGPPPAVHDGPHGRRRVVPEPHGPGHRHRPPHPGAPRFLPPPPTPTKRGGGVRALALGGGFAASRRTPPPPPACPLRGTVGMGTSPSGRLEKKLPANEMRSPQVLCFRIVAGGTPDPTPQRTTRICTAPSRARASSVRPPPLSPVLL